MGIFQDEVLAEFSAVNTAVITCLKHLALQQPDPKAFLSDILDSGLVAMERTNYVGLPADRKEAVLEDAKARYTDLVTSIRLD